MHVKLGLRANIARPGTRLDAQLVVDGVHYSLPGLSTRMNNGNPNPTQTGDRRAVTVSVTLLPG